MFYCIFEEWLPFRKLQSKNEGEKLNSHTQQMQDSLYLVLNNVLNVFSCSVLDPLSYLHQWGAWNLAVNPLQPATYIFKKLYQIVCMQCQSQSTLILDFIILVEYQWMEMAMLLCFTYPFTVRIVKQWSSAVWIGHTRRVYKVWWMVSEKQTNQKKDTNYNKTLDWE